MISHKAKYALRALVALAQAPRGQSIQISDIAEAQSIPRKFLEQILLDLKHHGFVASRRGKFGGYQLLRDAGDITIGQILRVVDGPIAPLPCLSKTAYRRCEDCRSEAECEIRHVFARVADATRGVLDVTTLADAARREPCERAQPMAARMIGAATSTIKVSAAPTFGKSLNE